MSFSGKRTLQESNKPSGGRKTEWISQRRVQTFASTDAGFVMVERSWNRQIINEGRNWG